jgi:hypothetical protein
MKIPNNAIIPDAKLTKYLLVFREDDFGNVVSCQWLVEQLTTNHAPTDKDS